MLCAVLDATALGPAPRDTAALLFGGGVDWIQLRDRSLEADELYRVARELVAARDARREAAGTTDDEGGPRRPRVIVNRRVDVARAAGADGVHLGFDALDVGDHLAHLAGVHLEPAESGHGVGAEVDEGAEVELRVPRLVLQSLRAGEAMGRGWRE